MICFANVFFFFCLFSLGFFFFQRGTKQVKKSELTACFLHQLLRVWDIVHVGAAGAHSAAQTQGRLVFSMKVFGAISSCSLNRVVVSLGSDRPTEDNLLSQSGLSS